MSEELNPGQGMQHVGAYDNRAAIGARMQQDGFHKPGNRGNRLHEARVMAAAALLGDVIQGRQDPMLFKEALHPQHRWAMAGLQENYPGLFAGGDFIGLRETMSYSDYSALTVDILDRLLYGYYTSAPLATMPLVKKQPLRDFRLVARYEMDGATRPFTRVPLNIGSDSTLVPHGALEPPTERAMQQAAREVLGSTQRVTYQPQLYQGMMSVNWRALINDDLGIFNDQTQRLAISGRRTISEFITLLYMTSAGFNANLVNSTFGNQVTMANGASSNNPALSFQGLLDAMTVLEKQLDLDGQPIQFEGTIYLVFGPALYTTAMSLVKAVQADISVGGGTTNAQGFPSQRLSIPNWPAQGIVPIQDKWIRIACTTAGIKDTAWGLFYDPNAQARPCLELGFLTGFDTPQIYQEVPNTMRVGGGVDPSMGNFYTMNQNFKGLLVMGGTQIDGRSIAMSTGQGV